MTRNAINLFIQTFKFDENFSIIATTSAFTQLRRSVFTNSKYSLAFSCIKVGHGFSLEALIMLNIKST
jgi:hypothetical protein